MRRTALLKLKAAELKQLCQHYGIAYAVGTKETREQKLVRRARSGSLRFRSRALAVAHVPPLALTPRCRFGSRFWWSACCA